MNKRLIERHVELAREGLENNIEIDEASYLRREYEHNDYITKHLDSIHRINMVIISASILCIVINICYLIFALNLK